MTGLEQLMEKWENVLEAYDTPRDFCDDSYVYLLENPEDKEDIPIRIIVTSGYSKREELMEKQRKELEKRKAQNLPLRWSNDGSNCFLCDNVGQAKDIGNNTFLSYDTYTNTVLLPNKYAAIRGHMLTVEKPHQNNTLSLSSRFFADCIEIAEKYDMALFRNHPKAGMSIPKHDHFHAYPKIVSMVSRKTVCINGLSDCNLKKTEFGKEIYSVSRTRFDTLAFRGKKALGKLIDIIEKLEKKSIIFTLAYESKGKADWNGTFFITPHSKEIKKVGSQHSYLGIVNPEEKADYTYNNFIELPLQGICKRGEFDWSKYF